MQHPTAADKAGGKAAGKAAMVKRKRADEDNSTLPEQPNKRRNVRQADTCSALPSSAARSAAPASVSKRKRADEASEDDAEYLPAQPSKRRNVTLGDAEMVLAAAAAPRRSARQTKAVNYCELEDTDMPDVSDVNDDQPALKDGKTAKSTRGTGKQPVRTPWR